MNRESYERAVDVMAELVAAAQEEESMPDVVPGERAPFQQGLKRLRELIQEGEPNFSRTTLGALVAIEAKVETMNLPLTAVANRTVWEQSNSDVKKSLAKRLAQRKEDFQEMVEREFMLVERLKSRRP